LFRVLGIWNWRKGSQHSKHQSPFRCKTSKHQALDQLHSWGDPMICVYLDPVSAYNQYIFLGLVGSKCSVKSVVVVLVPLVMVDSVNQFEGDLTLHDEGAIICPIYPICNRWWTLAPIPDFQGAFGIMLCIHFVHFPVYNAWHALICPSARQSLDPKEVW